MFRSRELTGTTSSAEKVESFSDLFDSRFKDHFIEWTKSESRYRVLDVDAHNDFSKRGKLQDINMILKKLVEAGIHPVATQLTKSDGLHIIFDNEEDAYVAYFIAAKIAGLTITGIEVLHRFRHYGRLMPFVKPSDPVEKDKPWNMVSVYNDRFLPEKSQDDIQQHKYNDGRLPHSDCPFNPTGGPDNNKSVVVTGNIIHCFRCNKTTTINSALQERKINLFFSHAKNLVPWNQAKSEYLRDLRSVGNGHLYVEDYCKEIYRILLTEIGHIKTLEPHLSVGEYCFSVYEVPMLGTDGQWHHVNGNLIKDADLDTLLRRIPSAQIFPNDKLEKALEKAEESGNAVRLPALGKYVDKLIVEAHKFVEESVKYLPKFNFIHGFDIDQLRDIVPYPTKDNVYDTFLVDANIDVSQIPRISADKKLNKGFDILKKVIKTDYLPTEHIVTGGLATIWAMKHGGANPILAVTGMSGSGKTTIGKIVASIFGIKHALVDGLAKNLRLLTDSALATGNNSIVIDEGLKRKNPNDFLTYSDRERYVKVLYKNPFSARINSVFYITGINIPKSYLQNSQFMRRVIQLPRLESVTSGANFDALYRRDKKVQEACTLILSALVDMYTDVTWERMEDYGEFREALLVFREIDAYKDIFTEQHIDPQEASRLANSIYSEEDVNIALTALYDVTAAIEKDFYKTSGSKSDIQRYIFSNTTKLGQILNQLGYEFFNEKDWGMLTGIEGLKISVKDARKAGYVALKVKLGRHNVKIDGDELKDSIAKLVEPYST